MTEKEKFKDVDESFERLFVICNQECTTGERIKDFIHFEIEAAEKRARVGGARELAEKLLIIGRRNEVIHRIDFEKVLAELEKENQ